MGKINTSLHKWLDGAYCVGIVEHTADEIIGADKPLDIHWIVPENDDTWMADPFIIDADQDVITLLVEEYEIALNKGRLSRIRVDRHNYKLLSSEPILTLDTHLSFPYPVYEDGKTYICPETNATKEAALYTYDGRECKYAQKLIDGKMLDSQILQLWDNGIKVYYTFSVRGRGLGMDDTKEVEVYRSESLTGPYELIQTIKKEKCEGRGAGPIFRLSDGRMIRPAQNCEGGYGKGVIFFQLELMPDGLFTETEIGRIDADESKRNGLCLHTFSPFGNIIAVDGFDYKNRAIAKFAPMLYGLKNLINKVVR